MRGDARNWEHGELMTRSRDCGVCVVWRGACVGVCGVCGGMWGCVG